VGAQPRRSVRLQRMECAVLNPHRTITLLYGPPRIWKWPYIQQTLLLWLIEFCWVTPGTTGDHALYHVLNNPHANEQHPRTKHVAEQLPTGVSGGT
jgi:hypothetical protein